MVDGGNNIKEATWESVSSMLQVVSRTLVRSVCGFTAYIFLYETTVISGVLRVARSLAVPAVKSSGPARGA